MIGNQCLKKCFNSSAERNKEPILSELKKILSLSEERLFLEISSGTGQHIAHIAPNFPNILFQPSEYDQNCFNSILAHINECPIKNICPPIHVDVSKPCDSWSINSFFESNEFPKLNITNTFSELKDRFDYILNINMIHISPFNCTRGLFENSAFLLKPNGFLLTYGPYAENGILTPESNVNFNISLKHMNPEYGVRDLKDLKELAMNCGIMLKYYSNMPANNKFVVWQKES